MATKTLSITEAAYHRLLAEKRPDESFTDVVLRLTGRRSLRDLATILSPGEAQALADAIDQNRKTRMARRSARIGRTP